MIAGVWIGEQQVAELERTREYVEFRYLPETTIPVATTLPMKQSPVRTQPGALPPFFAGLLTEGRRLSALKRSVKTSADDDLGLLLAVGGNTVGRVVVLPEGERPKKPEASIDLDAPDLDFENVLADAGVPDPNAIAGVQEKASARTIAFPMGEEAIVKISPPEYPWLVENEYACIQAFRGMKGQKNKIVDAKVIRDQHGRSGLVIKRSDGQFPHKHAVEDAGQLLNIYPADKYNVSFEEVTEAVLGVVSSPILAAQGLATQLAFSWLSGNGDLHAKNVSVINKGKGFELAPVYDIPSTAPYGDTSMALSVAGNRNGLSRKRFLKYCEDYGLSEKKANSIADEAVKATDNLARALIDACPWDSRRQRDLVRILRSRRRHW